LAGYLYRASVPFDGRLPGLGHLKWVRFVCIIRSSVFRS